MATVATLVGAVTDVRHRGRVLFFAGVQPEGDEAPHQCLFKGASAGGPMEDERVRALKRTLRPGDTVSVSVCRVEAGTPPLHHAADATLLLMNVKSNTGVQRSVAAATGGAQGPDPLGVRSASPVRSAAEEVHGEVEGGHEEEMEELSDEHGIWSAEADTPVRGDEGRVASRSSPHADVRHEYCHERCTVFGSWVLDVFGDRLGLRAGGEGGEVLDVAGGKGELSLFLALRGVRCTLVDPRVSFLSRRQRKQLRRSASARPFERVREEFVAGSELAGRASLVLGMHPDEVTEAIVDAAIGSRVPFAVVPCCVFSRLFPHRAAADGSQVRTHAQLVEYLAAKHANARVATLPFPGKNTVVYVESYEASPDSPRCEPCEDSEVPGLDTS